MKRRFTSQLIYKTKGDLGIANRLKNLLEKPKSAKPDKILKTIPSWKVVLLSENYISTSYKGISTVIGGDPVIITPECTINNKNPGMVRNVVENRTKGVICMGDAGEAILNACNSYWGTWKYTDQRPSALTGFMEGINIHNKYLYTWIYGHDVWVSPYFSTAIANTTQTNINRIKVPYPANNAPIQINRSYISGKGIKIKSTNGVTPIALLESAKNYKSSSDMLFSIVSQGRFIYYGYNQLLDERSYARTVGILLLNLVHASRNGIPAGQIPLPPQNPTSTRAPKITPTPAPIIIKTPKPIVIPPINTPIPKITP